MEPTVVLLLSDKRSGSTMFERELCCHPDVRHVEYTPHSYSETQHWLKGARLLGMPRQTFYGHRFYGSVGNVAATRAMMVDEILGNVPEFEVPSSNEELTFAGWEALCAKFARPVFFEKSPHHLMHWACQAAILRWMQRTRYRVRIVGLVRNPLAVQYSAFELFRSAPADRQYAWAESTRNLLAFRQLVPEECFCLVRYEDIIANPREEFMRIHDFIGLEPIEVETFAVHGTSLRRWAEDPKFRLQLHLCVRQLALHLGYSEEELHNPEKCPPSWRERVGDRLKAGARFVGRYLYRGVWEPLQAWRSRSSR